MKGFMEFKFLNMRHCLQLTKHIVYREHRLIILSHLLSLHMCEQIDVYRINTCVNGHE